MMSPVIGVPLPVPFLPMVMPWLNAEPPLGSVTSVAPLQTLSAA